MVPAAAALRARVCGETPFRHRMARPAGCLIRESLGLRQGVAMGFRLGFSPAHVTAGGGRFLPGYSAPCSFSTCSAMRSASIEAGKPQ